MPFDSLFHTLAAPLSQPYPCYLANFLQQLVPMCMFWNKFNIQALGSSLSAKKYAASIVPSATAFQFYKDGVSSCDFSISVCSYEKGEHVTVFCSGKTFGPTGIGCVDTVYVLV